MNKILEQYIYNVYTNQKRTKPVDFLKISFSLFQNLGSRSEAGGAISATSVVFLNVQHCLFDNDVGLIGGGFYASSCSINIFSSCFSRCQGSRASNDDGGNAATFTSSHFISELISADNCAPQTSSAGDGVFNGVSSKIRSRDFNSSNCKGISGECCFTNPIGSNSITKFMNVASCMQYCLICLPRGVVSYANFIDNVLSNYYLYTDDEGTTLENCCFFGNTNKGDHGTHKYINCFGDVVRTGITKPSITTTQQQTRIEFGRCLFQAFNPISGICSVLSFSVSITIFQMVSHA